MVAGGAHIERLHADLAAWEASGYQLDHRYELRITPYYASLIEGPSALDPVARQCVPRREEDRIWGLTDALGEGAFEPVPGLLHVYEDRVLLLSTERCAVNCRHCNRRWRRNGARPALDEAVVAGWLDYLRRQTLVREVLITGGDPLTLPVAAIESLLGRLFALPNRLLIRIGSRIPAVWPERISPALLRVLKRHRPLYLHTQFNAVPECTGEAAQALNRLADAGVNLGNQMVLLAGVNDDVDTIVEVNRWLVDQRCRPYYLFVPEKVQGTGHFQVPVARAAVIADGLRRQLSGLAMPTVAVDTPDGGGKVPLYTAAIVRRGGRVGIRDLKGRMVWW